MAEKTHSTPVVLSTAPGEFGNPDFPVQQLKSLASLSGHEIDEEKFAGPQVDSFIAHLCTNTVHAKNGVVFQHLIRHLALKNSVQIPQSDWKGMLKNLADAKDSSGKGYKTIRKALVVPTFAKRYHSGPSFLCSIPSTCDWCSFILESAHTQRCNPAKIWDATGRHYTHQNLLDGRSPFSSHHVNVVRKWSFSDSEMEWRYKKVACTELLKELREKPPQMELPPLADRFISAGHLDPPVSYDPHSPELSLVCEEEVNDDSLPYEARDVDEDISQSKLAVSSPKESRKIIRGKRTSMPEDLPLGLRTPTSQSFQF
jgi:hypothetical protein